MLGAYEGLMKASPQAMGQGMGGQAQPVGWKDESDVSDQQINRIMDEIEHYHARHTSGQDLSPAEIAHVHGLHQRLNSAESAREHAQQQMGVQAGARQGATTLMEDIERNRARLRGGAAGKIPPPATQAPMGR